MKRTVLTVDGVPAAIGPYSQAILAGGLIFTSGQIPLNPATGDIVPGGIREQAAQALDNLKALLEGSGVPLKNVVRTTLYLKNMGDFPVVNEIYGAYFNDSPPARSTVEVAALPKGVLVEIDAVAVTNEG